MFLQARVVYLEGSSCARAGVLVLDRQYRRGAELIPLEQLASGCRVLRLDGGLVCGAGRDGAPEPISAPRLPADAADPGRWPRGSLISKRAQATTDRYSDAADKLIDLL